MNSNLLLSYRVFAHAAIRCDTSQLGALVDTRQFKAVLPGGPENGMDYAEFLAAMRRQAQAFPDFGQNVAMHRIVTDGNTIVAYYTMRVTHRSAPPGAPVVDTPVRYSAVDIVVFDDEGRVVDLVVMSDRLSTIQQLDR